MKRFITVLLLSGCLGVGGCGVRGVRQSALAVRSGQHACTWEVQLKDHTSGEVKTYRLDSSGQIQIQINDSKLGMNYVCVLKRRVNEENPGYASDPRLRKDNVLLSVLTAVCATKGKRFAVATTAACIVALQSGVSVFDPGHLMLFNPTTKNFEKNLRFDVKENPHYQ